jgi:hypothetical protein
MNIHTAINNPTRETIVMAANAREALRLGNWVALVEMAFREEFARACELLDAKTRRAIKALQFRNVEYRVRLVDSVMAGDDLALAQLCDELSEKEKELIWRSLDSFTQQYIQQLQALRDNER